MSTFSGQFNWLDGLVWKVIFISSDIEQPHEGRVHLCDALVDTGATKTAIAKSVADELQLKPSGKIDMQTAGGLVSCNVYDVKLGLLIPTGQDQVGNIQGQIQIIEKTIRAPEFDSGSGAYKALIGRDILSSGVLTLSPDGHYSFAF